MQVVDKELEDLQLVLAEKPGKCIQGARIEWAQRAEKQQPMLQSFAPIRRASVATRWMRMHSSEHQTRDPLQTGIVVLHSGIDLVIAPRALII